MIPETKSLPLKSLFSFATLLGLIFKWDVGSCEMGKRAVMKSDYEDSYESGKHGQLWSQLWVSIKEGLRKEGIKEELVFVWAAFSWMRESADLLETCGSGQSLASQKWREFNLLNASRIVFGAVRERELQY